MKLAIKNSYRLITISCYFLLLTLSQSTTLAQTNGKQLVAAVDAIGFTVSDMDRSVEFFTNVLHFEKISDVEVWGDEYEHLQGLFGIRMRVVRMRLGEEIIELTDYLTPGGRPIPVDSRSNDHWFQHIAIVVSDMDKAYANLRKFKVTHASTAPQRLPDWNKGAAGIRAFYFRDPDDHNLEIIYFPPGKGNPKWQRAGGKGQGADGQEANGKAQKIFLGIDHTAIVVRDTDESLKFYRDLLGMEIGGESNNYGTEQEHLNNVFGANLRITSVHASKGPAIEFLEYLAPSDGRPYPGDARADDLMHWQTTLVAADASSVWQHFRKDNIQMISAGVVAMPDMSFGFAQGFLARDPTGHALRVVEQ